ncbi:Crp/Fnr family transcriptional regulator [Cysteiniphilum halobium]|uniref:Crp/Fnr family transcriptional regulator n=1 Tax=Cysteiniphilum halobium TaxID=2219059 RepID=UPI003F87D318
MIRQVYKPTDRPKTCHFCDCRDLCNALNINSFDNDRMLTEVKSIVVNVKKGDALYAINRTLTTLYSVRAGSFKLVNSHEHIIDFCLQGDALGFDGIETSYHQLNAIALEDSTVCGFDYHSFVQTIAINTISNLDFLQLMGKKMNAITHLIDASYEAHIKLAQFIYRLSYHQKRCGYSNKSFTLPMKHLEIANHLNLSIETVSRAFKTLAKDEIVQAKHKDITILDMSKLKTLVLGCKL